SQLRHLAETRRMTQVRMRKHDPGYQASDGTLQRDVATAGNGPGARSVRSRARVGPVAALEGGVAEQAVATITAPAGARPACEHSDHRTLWLKDLYRGDQVRLVPFGPNGVPCRPDWLELTHFFRDRHGHRRTVSPALLRSSHRCSATSAGAALTSTVAT